MLVLTIAVLFINNKRRKLYFSISVTGIYPSNYGLGEERKNNKVHGGEK